MKTSIRKHAFCGLNCIAVLMLGLVSANADVKLPRIFSDNMVLQRDIPVAVWGWAEPGEKVTVTVGKKSATATTDAKGNWSLKIGPFSVGTPLEMTVSGKNTLTLKNVLVGDVWICSGQSNMAWPVKNAADGEHEIAAANYPAIRHFTVDMVASTVLLNDTKTGEWQECSPKTVGEFSAVGYYFARQIHQTENIPVGLIFTAWGSASCEPFISFDTLNTYEPLRPVLDKYLATAPHWDRLRKEYEEGTTAWGKMMRDLGGALAKEGFQDPTFDDQNWKTMKLPTFWEMAGYPDVDGICWFRKQIDLPAEFVGKDLTVQTGSMDDADVTYVNGTVVGVANGRYRVPAELAKAGKMTIVVAAIDFGGYGGFGAKPEEMFIGIEGQKTIRLDGSWKFAFDTVVKKADQGANSTPWSGSIAGTNGTINITARPQRPRFVHDRNAPSVVFNGVMNPVIPYGIKGALWYQGESNVYRAYQYREIFPMMIKNWRDKWQLGDFPFIFAQLASFDPERDQPGDSMWAELREAQHMTLSLPNVGEAVTTDIGAANDIHPPNKQDVGKRMALYAEAKVYGKKLVYSGPSFKEAKIEGNKIRLSFDHVGGGLVARNGAPLKYFAIAGIDQKFVWAEAKIDGKTVVVSSDKVAEPVAVRYAWADNAMGANLFNKDGLPASPFRTDTWPGRTVKSTWD